MVRKTGLREIDITILSIERLKRCSEFLPDPDSEKAAADPAAAATPPEAAAPASKRVDYSRPTIDLREPAPAAAAEPEAVAYLATTTPKEPQQGLLLH